MDYCCDFDRDLCRLRNGELKLNPRIYDTKTGTYDSDINQISLSPDKALDVALKGLEDLLK